MNQFSDAPIAPRHNQSISTDSAVMSSNLIIPNIPYFSSSKIRCCIPFVSEMICSEERTLPNFNDGVYSNCNNYVLYELF